MSKTSTEVAFDEERLERLLAALSEGEILVGGQALRFWLDQFDIPYQDAVEGTLTKDADILGSMNTVARIAKAMGGMSEFPPAKGFGTSLLGQVLVDVGDAKVIGVDVLRALPGLNADKVRARAVTARVGDKSFLVLHPMDCFQNKVENVAKIAEKAERSGVRQACLAVLVARSYIERLIGAGNHRLAVAAIEHVAKTARSTVGKRNRLAGVELYEAIPLDRIKEIQVDNFVQHRLPRLEAEMEEMSDSSQSDDGDDFGPRP